MNAFKLTKVLLFVAAFGGSTAAFACGELQFNAGKGLPFQSYVAPRPANVLILASPDGPVQAADYEALEKAGHRLTLVSDSDAMAQALRRNDYDVVIAALESVDSVTEAERSAVSMPRLLPIVSRSARKSPQVRERFQQFVLVGASIGQYLTAINRILAR